MATGSISAQELHQRSKEEVIGKDLIVVDVRRTDIENDDAFIIPGAINLPAQTFQATLSGTVAVLKNIKTVIFHCSSSNGRGPRCAGWYQAALDEHKITSSRAVVLEGGIKAWRAAYPDEVIKTLISAF